MVDEPSLREPLKDMGLLLIRPAQGVDEFSLLAAESGATIYHHPVMRIVELPDNTVRSAVDGSSIWIFISRTAARITLNKMREQGLAVPQDKACFAIGKSTAEILLNEGFAPQFPTSHMTTEGLLSLPGLDDIAHKRISIFCGEGGREELMRALLARGALVQRHELYRRELCANEETAIRRRIGSGQLNGVVAHSGELLQHLLSLASADSQCAQELLQLPLFVPSQRVAELAQKAKFRHVIAAPSALPQEMVSVIGEWYSKQSIFRRN